MANTLMSVTNASFLPNQGQKRRFMRRRSSIQQQQQQVQGPSKAEPTQEEQQQFDANKILAESAKIKQGWSLLAALHCVLLPDLLSQTGFEAPKIEILARRWQERCTEIRDAAQALLLRELARLGQSGRRGLLEQWSPFLPSTLDASVSIFGSEMVSVTGSVGLASMSASMQSFTGSLGDGTTDGSSSLGGDDDAGAWSIQEIRRHQSTSVVLLGVIGSQYPAEIVPQPGNDPASKQADHTIARTISQCLLELLIHQSTSLLPAYSALRRTAIDLLGRGFPVWQPYIDISKVLIGLLELCVNADKLIPKGPIYFPLVPSADTCRTARHALSLIATHRPQAFIIALSKEISRYNQITHQSVSGGGGSVSGASPSQSPLPKTKSELLRIIEVLCDKQAQDVIEMIIPVGEILVFCLDPSVLKQRPLNNVFPAISKFHMVAYCSASRRLAFGGKNGSLALHELRGGKSQTIQAHSRAITATAFSEDGKYLATYSAEEGKLNFWQASQSFLGMGQSQIKVVRQIQAPNTSAFPAAATPGGSPTLYKAKLKWLSPKAVTLMLPNGKEHRLAMV